MKKRNITFALIVAICAVVIVIVAAMGRKELKNDAVRVEKNDVTADMEQEEPDYSGLGNEQGNLENGGAQTYLESKGILIALSDEENAEMLYFNDDSQQLQFFCEKESCLHTGGDCISNQQLMYLCSYSSVVFGVSVSSRNEIWKVQNNEVSCFYRADSDKILGMWAYRGYIYYMGEFSLYRLPINNSSGVQKVLDRPILYEYLTFYGDKMYFCQEDTLLYQANLDGSGKVRFCDEKLVSPQVCDGWLYYRSMEYDKTGVYQTKNTLKAISLKNKKEKKILDEVYQFCTDTKEKKIYYEGISKSDDTTLNVLDLKTGKSSKLADCASAYMYEFPQSDWIVFAKHEGELEEGEVGGRPEHLYCVRKDGSAEKRLEYPERIQN